MRTARHFPTRKTTEKPRCFSCEIIVLKNAIDFALGNAIPLELYSSTLYFVEQESWRTDIHKEFFGLGPTLVRFADIWKRERIIKGGIVVSSPEEAAKVKHFGQEFSGRLDLG